VFGVGPRDAELMLLGEAPGVEDALRHEPFVGPAGKVLSVACHLAGVAREKVYITNTVKCLPPRRGESHAPTKEEVEFCKSRWLNEELAEISPRVVVPIGGVALEALTGLRGITEWRGSVMEV